MAHILHREAGRSMRRLAMAAAIVLLMFAVGFAQMRLLRGATKRSRINEPDGVAAREERLSPLKAALVGHRSVGYVTDAADEKVAKLRYLSALYTLAPVILERSTGWPLVVGEFDDPSSRIAVCAQAGLIVQQDLGDGLVLLRKEAP